MNRNFSPMQHGAAAYARTSKTTVTPRELEAQLLLKAAARLTALRDRWNTSSAADIEQALEFNKRLWLVFTSAVTRPENPLPNALKSNIANLAIFIFGRHLEMIGEPHPAKLGALITINREIAAGLMVQPQSAQMQTAPAQPQAALPPA
jgi:flagellar biosynthesis activator protein FlaF